MKKINLILLLLLLEVQVGLSQNKPITFKNEKRIGVQTVQDQGNSGTCWCFSSNSFLESEMQFYGAKDIPNLSEMFVVRYSYLDKAKKYVMMHGNNNFSQGGMFFDNIYVLEHYGMVPEEVYPNTRKAGKIDHTAFERKLKLFVDSVASESNKTIDTIWVSQFESMLDEFLGAVPDTFVYKGKNYTPKSFAEEYIKLDANNYMQVTSFNHHPMFENFALEIPDNWRWSMFYNVPVDSLTAIIDRSLTMGHTVGWASDVSEIEFNISYSRGYVRYYKWNLDQDMRQEMFNTRKTTDDHGMVIVGTADASDGNTYYVVKNSWGNYNKYNGFFYVTKDYIKAKTTGLLVNKEVVIMP